MTIFFKRERETKGGKKAPRKKDTILSFTFSQEAINDDAYQSDTTDSAPGNDELELITELEIHHDHGYGTRQGYKTPKLQRSP